jgi:hypothetical protein
MSHVTISIEPREFSVSLLTKIRQITKLSVLKCYIVC